MKLSIYQLKPQFQRILAPLLSALLRWNISPNQITVSTMGLSLLFGLSLAVFPNNPGLWIAFPFFMLLRMALNAIDGMLANASGKKTALGALLNEICDQISDAALYLPFALLPGVHAPLLIIVVVIALLAEFAGVIAISIGADRRFDGPMGKSDRAFSFSLLAICVVAHLPPIWLNGLLSVILLLLGITIVNRLRQALLHHQSALPRP
jgi:CDP-diacylglycerol--glycerol-3-phosphate 3-phosphatidyltransferase